MMKDMSVQYELSQIYTNHCIRSTAIEILNAAVFNDREIMKISGHKSVTSLQSYHNIITVERRQSISQSIGKAVISSANEQTGTKSSKEDNIASSSQITRIVYFLKLAARKPASVQRSTIYKPFKFGCPD